MIYKKWKEAVKTVILILLILSIIFIYQLNWVYRLDRDELMHKQSWVSGFAQFFGIIQKIDQSALSMEVKPAVYPMKVAARNQRGLYSILYNQDAVMDFYKKTVPVFTRVLESAQQIKKTDETEYKKALQGKMIYFGYDAEIPFYAFSEWIHVSGRNEFDLKIRHIVLEDDSGTLSIFFRNGIDGEIYKIKTQVSSAQLLEQLNTIAPNNASFAFEKGNAFSSVEPETVLWTTTPLISKLSGYLPSIINDNNAVQTLLEAFGFNPYTVKNYKENNGTLVYVEKNTMRVEPDGTVRFLVSDAQNGIPVSGILSGDNGPTAVVRMIEAARFLVDRASANVRGDAAPYLRRVLFDSKTQTYNIYFDMQVSGVPIFRKEGSAAQIEIKDGMISSATLHLRNYKKTSEDVYLIPQKQAISIYSTTKDMNGAFWVRYEDLKKTQINAAFFID
ncbi:MAG: hypothetical protein N2Z65_00805 [Clostridiales bacterium]|nr:hypothetical protein [Clostridiales bacterium]